MPQQRLDFVLWRADFARHVNCRSDCTAGLASGGNNPLLVQMVSVLLKPVAVTLSFATKQ